MYRALVLCAGALAASVSGCAGGGDPEPGTQLTIVAVNPNVGRAVFRVACGPARGDVPSPERACAALQKTPELVTRPRPFVCRGGPFSWWQITVSGTLDGRAVRSRTSSCWTPQMALIRRLGIARALTAHLVPRRREEVVRGTSRTIPAGTLRPGDLVVCWAHGRRLELGVPTTPETSPQTGYNGVGIAPVALTVIRHRDGSVTASCR